MKLLANENIPASAILALRDDGHDVLWARTDLPGAADRQLLDLAVQESRLLVTFDKDFGELVFRQGLSAPCGVILFRLDVRSPEWIAQFMASALAEPREWRGHFAVVEADRIRMVPLASNRPGS
jgi:predicted nuclease of predicted toxin-antitoxin system